MTTESGGYIIGHRWFRHRLGSVRSVMVGGRRRDEEERVTDILRLRVKILVESTFGMRIDSQWIGEAEPQSDFLLPFATRINPAILRTLPQFARNSPLNSQIICKSLLISPSNSLLSDHSIRYLPLLTGEWRHFGQWKVPWGKLRSYFRFWVHRADLTEVGSFCISNSANSEANILMIVDILSGKVMSQVDPDEDIQVLTSLGTSLIAAIFDLQPLQDIKALIEAGAPLWYQDDKEGLSPLHAAAFVENPELVKFLIDQGVVWNAGEHLLQITFMIKIWHLLVDHLQNTAGDVALSLNNEECYILIRDAGLRSGVPTSWNVNPCPISMLPRASFDSSRIPGNIRTSVFLGSVK